MQKRVTKMIKRIRNFGHERRLKLLKLHSLERHRVIKESATFLTKKLPKARIEVTTYKPRADHCTGWSESLVTSYILF